MGKYIGGLIFVGGAFVIWSLITPRANGALMFVGCAFILAAVILFIKGLSQINKNNK